MPLRNSLGHPQKNHLDPTEHSDHELPISCSKKFTPSYQSLLFSSSLLSCSYKYHSTSIHTYSHATSLIPWLDPIRFHEPELRMSAWTNSIINLRLHHLNILSWNTSSAPIYFYPSYAHAILFHISTGSLKSSHFWASIFFSPYNLPSLVLPSFNIFYPIFLLLSSTKIYQAIWNKAWLGLAFSTAS